MQKYGGYNMQIKQKRQYKRKKGKLAVMDVNKIVKVFETQYDKEFQRKVTEILNLQKKLSMVYFCLGVTLTLITINILMMFGVL
jgi:hypothetical protein